MKKRILAWLLPMLLLCLLPVAAMAAGTALPEEKDGVITLTDDVTLADKLTLSASTTIDLNGCTLNAGNGIVVTGQNVTVTIRDSKSTGKITSNVSNVVQVTSKAQCVLESGTIEATKGTGIKTSSGTVFTMNGGTVTGTKHGINAYSGTVTVTGGKVLSTSKDKWDFGVERGSYATVVIGTDGAGDNSTPYISSVEGIKGSHKLTVYSGTIGSMNGDIHKEDVLGGVYETSIDDRLPNTKVCKLGEDGLYRVVPLKDKADANALIKRGNEEILYPSAFSASRAMQDGDTLVLLSDMVRNESFALIKSEKANNVIIDLNGHKVVNTYQGPAGKGIECKTPNNQNGSTTIMNSSTQPAYVEASVPIMANSNTMNIVKVDGNVQLKATDANSPNIKLSGSAVLEYSEEAAIAFAKGGFKCVTADGKAYIYGGFEHAIANDADKTVELLNDYTGNNGFVLSADTGVIDLAGHTYTYTGAASGNGAIWSSEDNTTVDMVIKNGTFISEYADGINLNGNNKKIVLDNVRFVVKGQHKYGIVTNGSYSGDNITLQNNAVLEVPNGIAIYFPSKNGKVLIDNSTVTAHTGVQVCGGNSVLEVNNSTITATGTPIAKQPGENDGPVLDGAAVSIMSRYQGAGETTKATLNGGTYESKATEAVKAYRMQKVDENWVTNENTTLENKIESIAIQGGEFIGGGSNKAPLAIDSAAVKGEKSVAQVTGGNFSAALDTKYLDPVLTTQVTTPTKNPQAPVSYHKDVATALEQAKGDNAATVAPTAPQASDLTVTFNVNGGEGAPASVTVAQNGTITLPTPTRAGYTFGGWEAQDGKSYKGGDSVKVAKAMTFTAVWYYNPPVDTYELTVPSVQNGKAVLSHSFAAQGATVTITATPDKGFVVDTVVVKDATGKAVTVTKNADGTYSFKMPASKVDVAVTFKVEQIKPTVLPFVDVAENDWFYPAVGFVYEQGMMAGMSDTVFAPNVTLSRAMMAQVLYNLEGTPTAGGQFTDVKDGDWYANAVNWAAKEGIVAGMGDGTFAPNDNLTREQMAAILYRFAKYSGFDMSAKGDLAGFADANKVSPWAQDSMSWAVGAGIVSGMGDNTLAPQGTATRAQVAMVLLNFCANMNK